MTLRSAAIRWMKHTVVLALAIPLVLLAPFASATLLTGQFNVTVKVGGEIGSSGICERATDPSAFGSIVTIVCATGTVLGIEAPRNAVAWTPIHGGAYRFTKVSPDEIRGVQYVQSTGSYTGIGTITSWRMVKLADSEYLEMLIDW